MHLMRAIAIVLLVPLVLAGCTGDTAPTPIDSGPGPVDVGVGPVDAGPRDGGPDAPRPDAGPIVTECGTPTFADGTLLRRHPYLQSVTSTSARVAWTTPTGGTPRVRFTLGAGPAVTVDAASDTFPTSRTGDLVDYVAHDALLTGLVPDAIYCYEVLDGDTVLASGLRLHAAWTTPHALRILAFGDSGDGSANQRALRDEMLAHDFDVFLHLGDMAYSDGTFFEFEQRFFGVYRGFMHSVPTFPAIGNHEYNTANGVPYLDVYYLFEQALRAADQERYYSFDYGDVHFIALDSNPEMIGTVSTTATDDMVDWARADLAATTAPWRIAFFHHPPYSSGAHGNETSLWDDVVPALEEGGIDLVLVGHDHHYERSIPITGGAAAAAGDMAAITYIVAGAGGAALRGAPGDWFTAYVNDAVFNFLLLEIDGCSAHGESIDTGGNVIDSFDLDGCE